MVAEGVDTDHTIHFDAIIHPIIHMITIQVNNTTTTIIMILILLHTIMLETVSDNADKIRISRVIDINENRQTITDQLMVMMKKTQRKIT